MRHAIRTIAAAAFAALCLCSGAGAKLVTIEIPGVQAENPISIDDKGRVTGYHKDASGQHGFLWQPDGAAATFDVPGAAATGVGDYARNAYGLPVAFLRAPSGKATEFTVPGATPKSPRKNRALESSAIAARRTVWNSACINPDDLNCESAHPNWLPVSRPLS